MSDERSELLKNLELLRDRLRHDHEQRAIHRDTYLPYHIVYDIRILQGEIAALKQRLYELGITVEDLPDELPRDNRPIGCPYPGMRPFFAWETSHFYGRSKEIEHLRQVIRYQHLIVVIGSSGSGKSSMITAGLLPKLADREAGTWLIHQMRPGTTPLLSLQRLLSIKQSEQQTIDYAQAIETPLLRVQAQRCLIFIDQFEELFAQTAPEEQKAFIKAILALSKHPNCVLILNLRADFYQDFLESELWPITDSQRLEIGPLRGANLRSAIEQPALDVGVELEPALVERLLADVANEPGVLPLLQETLILLWEQMKPQNRMLRLRDYEGMSEETTSGLHVAIALLADKALADLTENAQPHAQAQVRLIAQRIFMRLVQFGQGRPHTRRQQTIADLRAANDDPTIFVYTLDTLKAHRLVTVDRHLEARDAVVDLAHEALISAWPTFKAWLKEYQIAEQFRRRLQDQLSEWKERRAAGRSGGLLDQDELQEAQQWLASNAAQILGYDAELLDFIKQSELAINPGWNRIGLITLLAAALGLTASIGWLIFGLLTANLPERFEQSAVLIILICIALFLLGLWFLLRRSEAYQLQRLSQTIRRRPFSLTSLNSFFLLAIVLWSTSGWHWLQSEYRCRELDFRHNVKTIVITNTDLDPEEEKAQQKLIFTGNFANMVKNIDPSVDVHIILDIIDLQECARFIDYRADISIDDSDSLYRIFRLNLFQNGKGHLKKDTITSYTSCITLAKFVNIIAETLQYHKKEYAVLFENTACEYDNELNKADSHAMNQKYDKAEYIYRKILKEDPGNIRARMGLLNVMNKMGRYDASINLLQEDFPRNIEFDYWIQSGLITSCILAEEYDCAEEAAKTIINSGFKVIDGYIDIISVYREKEQYDLAELYIREAEMVLGDLDPTSDIYNRYKYMIMKQKGTILFYSQRYPEAQALFDQVFPAREELGIEEEILYYQARIKEEQKDFEGACEKYRYHIAYARLDTSLPGTLKRLKFSEERFKTLGC